MQKLVSANFYRVFHSKIFWIMLFVMPIPNLYLILDDFFTNFDYYMQAVKAEDFTLNFIFQEHMFTLSHVEYIAFFIALIMGLLIGDEFGRGTFRNKMISGYTRTEIYLSYFLTIWGTVLIMHLTAIVIPIILIFVMYGVSFKGIGTFMIYVLYSVVPIGTFTAIMLFFISLIRDKAIGTATALMTAFMMMFFSSNHGTDLVYPERYTAQELQKQAFLERIMPDGYIRQILFSDSYVWHHIFETLPPPPVTCGILGLLFLTAGILIFRKINLK